MSCIFNKNLQLQICNRCGSTEERTLNLVIINSQSALQIKIRDPSEYTFNYTETIDLGDYEIMRAKQNLDINFAEFVSNLLELLQQIQQKEMFLRCETDEQLCTLTFYNKSKIKSIVYLTVDLHATSQKEILNEVMTNIQFTKESNDRLQMQVSNLRKLLADKDKELKHVSFCKSEIEKRFYSILKEVEDTVTSKTVHVESLVLRKIKIFNQITENLSVAINQIRQEISLRSDSSSRLLRTLENVNIENKLLNDSIEKLKLDNTKLHGVNLDLEKNLSNLRFLLNEKDAKMRESQSKNEELRNDMEKATIIIAQKKATIDELSKDLVQANQMLVNFNNHYDSKVKALEILQSTVLSKNQVIENERQKNYDLQKEFDGYRVTFNAEVYEKMKNNLVVAQSKIDELEKSIRKANKINALLSEKVTKIGL